MTIAVKQAVADTAVAQGLLQQVWETQGHLGWQTQTRFLLLIACPEQATLEGQCSASLLLAGCRAVASWEHWPSKRVCLLLAGCRAVATMHALLWPGVWKLLSSHHEEHDLAGSSH